MVMKTEPPKALGLIFIGLMLLSELSLIQTEGIFQTDLLLTAELGDDVTLQCFCPKEESSVIAWYKQTVGKKPQLISLCYTYDKNVIFYNEFKDNARFRVQSGLTWINLTISKTQMSDSASYYCGKAVFNTIEFAEGTFLMLKGSELNSRTVVQQPMSEPVQPGDSVTLQCTIHTETCAGEHIVYWFRQGSGESSPGVIYTHGNSSDQCERSSGAGSPTQSCVFKLPKTNLSLSDAGTYYCAVATCGEILFGNGTKLDLEDNHSSGWQYIVVVLAVTVMVSLTANLILLLMWRRAKRVPSGFSLGTSASPVTQSQDTDSVNYAALSFESKNSKNGRRRREVEIQPLYADVRQQRQ